MGTKLEALQAKQAKLLAELQETNAKLNDQVKAEAEFEAQAGRRLDFIVLSDTEGADFLQSLLDQVGYKLPEGKVAILTLKANGTRESAIVDEKVPKVSKSGNGSGNGHNEGAKGITLADGTKTSWAEVCRDGAHGKVGNGGLDYGVGSAHTYFFRHARDLHDTVPHVCDPNIDGHGYTYPLS